MKKYIIVTGGAGFIGSNLIKLLLQKTNNKIISIDNYSSGYKKNHIYHKNVTYFNCNIKNIRNKLDKIQNKIKVVFHFREFSRIYQSFIKTKECIDTNITGTAEVFLFCLDNKIKIIYSATSASLGNKGYDQNLSPYSFTKAKNLEFLRNLKNWHDLSYEVLFFFNVYGPGQIKKGPMSTVIGIFERLFEEKKPITIVKPGNQSRKFTHIDDTVNGCFFAWKKNKNRYYILSNSKSYTITEVAKLFSNKIKFLPPRLGERYKSSIIKKINNIKLYRFPCNKNLNTYITNFKKNLGM